MTEEKKEDLGCYATILFMVLLGFGMMTAAFITGGRVIAPGWPLWAHLVGSVMVTLLLLAAYVRLTNYFEGVVAFLIIGITVAIITPVFMQARKNALRRQSHHYQSIQRQPARRLTSR